MFNPQGFFSYHWVGDHINVAADIGANCQDMEQSLRHTMFVVLGPVAINEEKMRWRTRQKALGLIFDSTVGSVSMPVVKVAKVANAKRIHCSCCNRFHHIESIRISLPAR